MLLFPKITKAEVTALKGNSMCEQGLNLLCMLFCLSVSLFECQISSAARHKMRDGSGTAASTTCLAY